MSIGDLNDRPWPTRMIEFFAVFDPLGRVKITELVSMLVGIPLSVLRFAVRSDAELWRDSWLRASDALAGRFQGALRRSRLNYLLEFK
jgi:hypothetical protein